MLLGLGILLLFRTFDARVLDPMVLAFWKFHALGPVILLVCGALLVWPQARAFVESRHAAAALRDGPACWGASRAGSPAEVGVDANVVRLAFVAAAALTFGLAVLLYLLLLLVVPEEELATQHPTVHADPPGGPGLGRPEP